ncbi:hypothetical protein D9M72_489240 [compost metagenome]
MLSHEQHGAAPFTTDGEALHEAQEHQERRRPVANLRECGEAAHREGGNTHQDDAQLEQLLPAEFVTEVAENDAADRAGNEAHCIGDESGDDPVQLSAGVGEEHLAENQGGR